MKVKVITETLTNLEIAKRQLDRSISLFFDEGDYISSLTLAGAAEEILGKLLNKAGAPHVLDELINGALEFNGIAPGSKEEPQARKAIANIANHFKNRVKHYNESGQITFSVDFYAAEIIDRAIGNYFSYTGQETEKMRKFKTEVLMGGNENA